MDAFLWSVDIACYDVDLIVCRLDFQIMTVGINGAFWDDLDQNFQIFNH